jgi:FkbM family methyltransferase
MRLYLLILRLYSSIFSKYPLSKLNNALLQLSLSARGFNNFSNFKVSGEKFFLEKILAPSKPNLCLDIGANSGTYSLEILKKTNSKVICFEPLKSSFDELKDNLSTYKDRVVFENLAISNEEKELDLHYNENAKSHASLSIDINNILYVDNKLVEKINTTTMDNYCKNNSIYEIDFIKIDTEGFELEVLKGSLNILNSTKPKYIQIEFNWHQLFREHTLYGISKLLPKYSLYQLIPNGWIERDPKDVLSNIYSYSNFVFVRK